MKKIYVPLLSINVPEVIGYRTKKEAKASIHWNDVNHAKIIKVKINKKKEKKNENNNNK